MRHIKKLYKRLLSLVIQFMDQRVEHINLLSEDLRKLALLMLGGATVGFFAQPESVINLTPSEARILAVGGVLTMLVGLSIFKPTDKNVRRK